MCPRVINCERTWHIDDSTKLNSIPTPVRIAEASLRRQCYILRSMTDIYWLSGVRLLTLSSRLMWGQMTQRCCEFASFSQRSKWIGGSRNVSWTKESILITPAQRATAPFPRCVCYKFVVFFRAISNASSQALKLLNYCFFPSNQVEAIHAEFCFRQYEPEDKVSLNLFCQLGTCQSVLWQDQEIKGNSERLQK